MSRPNGEWRGLQNSRRFRLWTFRQLHANGGVMVGQGNKIFPAFQFDFYAVQLVFFQVVQHGFDRSVVNDICQGGKV